jgi:hypothetical protein
MVRKARSSQRLSETHFSTSLRIYAGRVAYEVLLGRTIAEMTIQEVSSFAAWDAGPVGKNAILTDWLHVDPAEHRSS